MSTQSEFPLRLELNEAARALRISRALLYVRIRAGAIKAQKDGKRTFIAVEELHRYVRDSQRKTSPEEGERTHQHSRAS